MRYSIGPNPSHDGPTSKIKRALNDRINFAADFETTTDPEDCRVWAWGLTNIDGEFPVEMDNSIESFIDRISFQNGVCYFHNLKFDGQFILYYLLTNGYRHKINDYWREAPKTFKTLISDMGRFYSITVCWENGNVTEFRDSLNKLPMTVERIARSFNMEFSKGDLDYDTFRPIGHKLTEAEADYLRRDVLIIAQAIRQVLNSGMTRLTVASDSLKEYKKLTTSKTFQSQFPVLSSEMDAEIRRAYRGGFTYADDRFSGKTTGAGLVLDVNSLYPSVMYSRLLPYGMPEYVDGKVDPTPERPLTIFSVTFTAKLKPNHIPCIQIKGSSYFIATEYVREINEPTTLMMTNVDFDLYNDHYDIEVLEWGGGWRFRAAEGMFDAYIEKWSKVKENSKGGAREIAKLHLNSLYGKFASNPNVTGKYPVLENGVVKLKRGQPETREPVYTAVGVFITSYARDLTIRAAQDNYPTFAYADTDSLHLLTTETPKNLEIHPTKLGAWKLEYHFDEAFYIRPKAYLERKSSHVDCHECDGTFQNAIAGVPVSVSAALTFADVVDGKVLEGKLGQQVVPGGVVLKNVPFELRL